MTNNKIPVCSICIANYNGKDFIDSCIESVLLQNCSFLIEIIVHDDASTDGSAEYIRKKYPEVKLIESHDNVGFCISNNRMADTAKGHFLLLLNNDAVLFPDALEKLYDHAMRTSVPSILGLPQYDYETGILIDMGSTFDPFLNPVPNMDVNQLEVGMVIGACLWLPADLWKKIGGFPEWFQALAEDMYLCCLARLKGFDVYQVPQSGFNHWVGKSIGGGKVVKNRLSTVRQRRALSERNKSYVMFLCYPAPLFHLIFTFHTLLLLIEGLLLALIKKDADVLSSIYVGTIQILWANYKKLSTLRKIHQANRNISVRNFFKPFSFVPYKLQMLIKHGIPQIK